MNLSKISFVDSSGLALLLEQRNVLHERGGDLWLVDAEDGSARRILDMVALGGSFSLYSTRSATVEEGILEAKERA